MLIHYIFYWIFVLLTVYNDSPFASLLGASGYSPLTSLSLVLGCIYFALNKRARVNQLVKKLFSNSLYIVAGSVVGILLWLIMDGAFTVLGENLIVKSFKVLLNYLSYPMFLFLLLAQMRKLTYEQVCRPIFAVFLFLNIFSILEYQQIPYAFQNLHYSGAFPYYRIRMLSQESSFTVITILAYGAISIYYSYTKKNIFGLILSVAGLVLQIVLTTSKSLMLLVFIWLFLYTLAIGTNKRRNKVLALIIVAVGAILAYSLISPRLKTQWYADIENYTSTATRSATLVVSLLIGLLVPTGVGGAYMGFFQTFLREILNIFNRLPIQLNLNEIENFVNARNDFAVTTSSGFLQLHMYWGIIGSVLFFRVLLGEAKKLDATTVKAKNAIKAMYWTIIFGIATTLPMNYDFIVFVAFCHYLITRYPATEHKIG